LTMISRHLFDDCWVLADITIPASVTYIDSGSFVTRSGMVNIRYMGTKDQWKAISKQDGWYSTDDRFVVHCTDGDVSIP